jgi:hypothetical protein
MRAGKSAGGKKSSKWNDKYAQLLDYKEENGDCLVPVNTSKLGRWVKQQRAQYRLKIEGKSSFLTDEQQAKLDEIGFSWRTIASWDDRFQQLVKIGSCSRSVIHSIDRSLHSWCHGQIYSRQQWKENKRAYQRELSSWKKSRRRGDRPTWRDQAQYEKWIKREELLDQLGFWDKFTCT